jgi:diadenosine tetraphosphate (Ap4A) HIT family hydrolase
VTTIEGTDDCLACGLSTGRIPLPGGLVHRTSHWRVEHCVGPLGVGTLLVKPERHVVHVADLTADEAAEMGPLLHLTSQVVTEVCRPDQVYVCLWSHAGFQPVHIHFVVQPVMSSDARAVGAAGPAYQAAMFAATAELPLDRVEEFCERAKARFVARTMPG